VCDALEAEAALQGLARDADYWDAGKLWIDAQCAARSGSRHVPGQSVVHRQRAGLQGPLGAPLDRRAALPATIAGDGNHGHPDPHDRAGQRRDAV
jgi:hypothetical protein